MPESDLVPFTVSPPQGNRVLVLAPHPDDETLGCGGTIRLLLLGKTPVKVIFLTSGDKADPSDPKSYTTKNHQHYHPHLIPPVEGGKTEERLLSREARPWPTRKGSSTIPSPFAGEGKGEGGLSGGPHMTEYALLREKEAVKALGVLGVSDYEFFRFPDRETDKHFDNVFERLLRIVETYKPDTIYSPSIIELNPDHRTTAALAMELQKTIMRTNTSALIHDAPPPNPPPRGGKVGEGVVPLRIVFYEVTTPLRPNMLVDVTPAYPVKKRAMKKYKSQLKISAYLRYITALNSFRALTVKGPDLVEAFWHMEDTWSAEDIADWTGYRKSLHKKD